MLAQKRPGLFVYLFGPLACRTNIRMTQGKASAATNQEFGNRVPDFSLSLLDLGLEDYIAHKKDAAVVFWSAACTHCIRYDEYFDSFTQSHPELGFFAIASRQGETLEQMWSTINQRPSRFPILADRSGRVARLWHSQQTPRCYLIAADGRFLNRGAVDNLKLAKDEAYLGYLEAAISRSSQASPSEEPRRPVLAAP